MSYTSTLTITIPADLYDIACAIARSLDPDVGGSSSFGPRQVRLPDVVITPESVQEMADENGWTITVTTAAVTEPGALITPDTYTTSTPCTDGFKEQALMMLTQPEMLHAVVSADYAARWANLTPPTLAECEAFCAGVVLE